MTAPLPVKVSELAAGHIRQAEDWWRRNRTRVPNAVREDLDKAFHLISTQPRVGARAEDVELEGVRRIYLARLKYHLYYRVIEDPLRVKILALWHKSRGEGPPL